MSRDELLELGRTAVTTDLATAGRAWGLGRTKVHELARAGELPFPVNRLGSVYKVPVEPLLRSLGLLPNGSGGEAPAPFQPAPLTAVGRATAGGPAR